MTRSQLLFALGCVFTLAAEGVEARPRPAPVVAQRNAQNRACTDCGTQTCGPPMVQCTTVCERPTIPPRSAESLERCRQACQDRWLACVATSCQACAGVYSAPPGVEPFPVRPGQGGGPTVVQVAPTAPARGRVVNLRRGR
ncbi:MAG: hypothetical protein JNK72_21660 [Myxococcales bacterium]|nr:hypothetical protein [Myxococcales bacterium]